MDDFAKEFEARTGRKNSSLAELDLPVRMLNSLEAHGVTTTADLARCCPHRDEECFAQCVCLPRRPPQKARMVYLGDIANIGELTIREIMDRFRSWLRGEHEMGWTDAAAKCHQLLQILEENVPDKVWAKSADFLRSMQDKLQGIMDNIEENRRVTARQQEAIESFGQHVIRAADGKEFQRPDSPGPSKKKGKGRGKGGRASPGTRATPKDDGPLRIDWDGEASQ